MKRLVVWMLACLLLFVSCDQTAGIGDHPTDDDTTVITVPALVDEDDPNARYIDEVRTYSLEKVSYVFSSVSTSSFSRDGIFYAAAGSGFDLLNADAELLEHKSFTYQDAHIAEHTLLADGRWACITGDARPRILLLDEASRVLAEADLPSDVTGMPPVVRAWAQDDGNTEIYVLLGNTFSVFDDVLNLKKTFSVPGEYNDYMHIGEDGSILIGDRVCDLLSVDLMAGTAAPYTAWNLPSEYEEAGVFYDCEGRVYLMTSVGVWQMREDHSLRHLMDWSSGTVRYGISLAPKVLDGDTILIEATLGNDLRKSSYILSPLTLDSGVPRRVIVLGLIEVDQGGLIAAAVDAFNRGQDTYYLELRDYYAENSHTENPIWTSWDVLEQEYLMGTPPDIICITQAGAGKFESILGDKGAFVSLDPYFGDLLHGGVRRAYTVDSQMSFLPLGMTLEALASAQSVTEGTLTRAKLEEIASSLRAGEALFSDPMVTEDLYSSAIGDFVDAEGKDCSFDSEEFCSFIRFCEQIEEKYLDTSMGYFNTPYSNESYISISDLGVRERLASGELKFLTAELCTAFHFASLKLLYGDTPYTLCGYPSDDGGGAYLYGMYPMAISASSKVKGGVYEFLSMLLSPEWQTDARLTDSVWSACLPTTKEGFAAYLDANDHFYMHPEKDWLPTSAWDNDLQTSVVIGTQLDPVLVTADSPTDAEWSTKNPYSQSRDPQGWQEWCDTRTEYVLTKEEQQSIMTFLDTCHMFRKAFYSTDLIGDIIDEELSAYKAGAKTLEDCAAIIQSRVWIYLNE